MISEERMREIAADWEKRTPEEKASILQKANQLHDEAQSWGPYYSAICSFSHRFSRDIAKNKKTDASWTSWVPIDESSYDGPWTAIEIAILEELRSPSVLAWDRISKYLVEAMGDPVVKANPEAVEVLSTWLHKTSFGGHGKTTADDLEPSRETILEWATSVRASEVASKKNADARAWVRLQWENRKNPNQSKAKFAREYVPLVAEEFGVEITEDTIKRDWLPKSAK